MDIRFYKLHVCGDDWILTDRIGADCAPLPDFSALSTALCRRRRGAGGHGLIVLTKPEQDIWAECYGPRGESIPLPPGAALCAARYWFDAGRGGKNAIELRVREGAKRVDVIDSTRFALSLGPALSPSGNPLREGEADRTAAAVDIAGKAFSILPVRVARESFAVIIVEDNFKDALAPFDQAADSENPSGQNQQRITPLAVKVISRTNLSVGGRPLDSCSAAAAALAAAGAYGLADREAAVRIGGDAVFVNGDADDGLYAAARAVYIFSGEYWIDGGEEADEPTDD